MRRLFFLTIVILLLLAACRQPESQPEATSLPPTPTTGAVATVAEVPPEPDNFLTVATDAPYPPFAFFDDFGTVIGFDAELADNILSRLDYDYEFVVTGYSGMLESVANGEFDLAIAALSRETDVDGVVYSEPYLEVGQVLVVPANESEILTYHDVLPGLPIGVVENSLAGRRAALEIVGVPEENLLTYETVGQALLALRDGQVSGVVLDSDDAEHYTRTHYEQLKIAGGGGPDSWITHHTYAVAVGADNPELLQAINEAIAEAQADGSIERITRNWLVSKETLDMGESLIGTPEDIIVIGMMGSLDHLDPAGPPDMIGWEIKSNTMSGLYMFDAQDNLVPVLAAAMPTVSEDNLSYTVTLRSDLTFPDGTAFTADDVLYSITRASLQGNWHVNAFLKDSDGDFIADADAIEVLSPTQVRFTLRQPTPFFANLLATPPYFIVSEECYGTSPDPALTCNGIGRYEVIEWEPGGTLQLQANPQWPGPNTPRSENIQIRFYNSLDRLRAAVELGAVDIAWPGLPDEMVTELSALSDVRVWETPPIFKSYLVFLQSAAPWDNSAVRQAVAYAINREELAESVFGGRRQPLYSPLPSSVPEAIPAEPTRDLERAQELLRLAGYNIDRRLVIPLWYLNDGRYTPLEEAYALAIKQQLEETGMIEVQLNSASWDIYSVQMSACNYPAFLLGWPPVGWPTRYPAAMGWLEYFVTNTDSLCSDYESLAMDTLLEEARQIDPADDAARQEVYEEIQNLWAEELPTLDLTQAGLQALAQTTIENVQFDGMGLLHYEMLSKQAESTAGSE